MVVFARYLVFGCLDPCGKDVRVSDTAWTKV